MSAFRHPSDEPARDPGLEPLASGSGSVQASELRRSIAQAAAQIDKIISAAEEAAGQIHADAERDAERYLSERRRQADLMLDQQRAALSEAFAGMRRQLGEIETSAIEAVEAPPEPVADDPAPVAEPAAPVADDSRPVAGDPGPAPQPAERPIPAPKAYPGVARAEPRPVEPAPSARAYESGASTASRLGSASHAPAVIRAAQLAILGKSREEIEVELRTELGIERPGEIVDEILPPG